MFDIVVATLAAATVSGNSTDQVDIDGRGVQLVIDITAITGTTPSATFSVQGKDMASGKYYNLLTSVALTAVGTTVLTIYPGIAASANVSANTVIPRVFRVSYTISGTTPVVTATIGASIID